VLAAARELASAEERALLDGPGDRSPDDEWVRELLRSTGAIDRARGLVRELIGEALAALDRTSLDERAGDGLRALAEMIGRADAPRPTP
jgi:geranylgeranyl pyrophosphate synthase